MESFLRLSVVFLVLLIPLAVVASPLVSVSIKAEKEVVAIVKGEKLTRRVAATTVDPGDVIFYTLNFINSGDEPATNVVFDDPIPKGTVYLPGSVFGRDAQIDYSIDGGKTYKQPTLLTYDVHLSNGRTEKRIASPDEYTNVRWTIGAIPAKGSGQVGFQVRMKQ